jgi:tetratricopeptide (TPR) repeat protein
MSDNRLMELEKSVNAEPESAPLRHLLGAHYAKAGRYEDAERELYRAVSLNPLAHVARLQLGLLQLTQGDAHRATSTWSALEALADGEALKSFKRGLEALIRDDFVACDRWLHEGIECNRANPALNEDMRLILARIAGRIQAKGAEPEPVRTDFSLYTTRH